MSAEDQTAHLKLQKQQSAKVLKGHQRVQEKVKEIRQSFSKALTAGTRSGSGSGKIVLEFYDKLYSIYGGSPPTEPFPYGVETDSFETY
eukprot:gene8338-9235_t